jgi:hypothetical protein
MIDRGSLTGYGERDGAAVLTFSGGRELRFIPEWKNDSVKRIHSVLLLDDHELVAEVVSGCFASGGAMGQRDLATYCEFAIDLEREVYRHYRMGKITEQEWQSRFRAYWKIVIKSRQIASALALALLPIREFRGKC